MADGLATTFETLAASRNDAANRVLLEALRSTDPDVYDHALKAVIARRFKPGHLEVLGIWHRLSPKQRQFLQEGRGRMSGALRDAVLSEDEQLFQNACEVVEHFKEFDLISTLVTLAENQNHAHAEAATTLVLRLTQQLSEMVHGPRDYNDRRNPESLARFVLESLERSVERFRTHNRSELIESFVILAGPSCNTLRQILEEPHHPCYLTVINTLTHSKCSGVIQFLVKSLKGEHTSLNILNVISKRDDPGFVKKLLELIDKKLDAKVAKNISRIRTFGWLKPGENGFESFEEEDQARCVKLVAASGVKADEFLDLLDLVLRRGEPAARWAACDALAGIPGERGNRLVVNSINDADPKVQAAATRQIRDRHVSNAMAILLKQIDSPHEIVREATCEALSEFSFDNFLAGFEGLHDDARRTTGALVKKVDSKTIAGLMSEMEEPSRKRRLRAIEMADVMELVPELTESVLELLDDEDYLVRAAAADVLQLCPTTEVVEALQLLTRDRSAAVKNAAKASLEVLESLPLKASPELPTAVGGEQ